jgi:imidazoleglycerol phosphate dehydratase HisB
MLRAFADDKGRENLSGNREIIRFHSLRVALDECCAHSAILTSTRCLISSDKSLVICFIATVVFIFTVEEDN